MSQSFVQAIVQDNEGFLWIGTQNGLNRYDGYKFKQYKSRNGETGTLSDSNILELYVDSEGILWVGTSSGGLNKYNRAADKFESFLFDNKDYSLEGSNRIWAIDEFNDKILLATDGGGIIKFHKETHQFERVYLDSSKFNNTFSSLLKEGKDSFWAGSSEGLFLIDIQGNLLKAYNNLPGKLKKEINNNVHVLYKSSDNKFWIGTGSGIVEFNSDTEKFHFYDINKEGKNILGSISVWDIIEYENKLLLGTDGEGLKVFDYNNQNSISFKSDNQVSNSLESNRIYDIYKDYTGVIWLGTGGGGINKILQNQKFPHYYSDKAIVNSLNNDNIWSFTEGRNNIWIGTENGGLESFNRATGEFRLIDEVTKKFPELKSTFISAIYEDDEILYLGTYGLGLLTYNTKTANVEKIENILPADNSMNYIVMIIADRDNNLWIGSYGGGVVKFNKSNKLCTYFNTNETLNRKLSSDITTYIYEDSKGVIWICTYNGLNKYDPKNDILNSYSYKNDFQFGINSNVVLSVAEDFNKNIWIGTDKGTNKLITVDGKTKFLDLSKDDDTDIILSLFLDSDGYFWSGTFNGIVKFNPFAENLNFIRYDNTDGLQGREFNIGAALKCNDGELFFGGNNGFNAFYPAKELTKNNIKPKVVLTDVLVFNESINHNNISTISELDNLVFSHKDYVITFEFAALHFVNPEKNKYAYKLEGLEENWNYVSAERRFATYTNLYGKEYTFRIKASNSDDIWNEEGLAVHFSVSPPFYNTTLFKFLSIVFIVIAVFLVVKLRTRIIKKRNIELGHINSKLNKEIEERIKIEFEKQKLNEELEQTNKELKQIVYIASHDLRTPLVNIQGFSKELDFLVQDLSDSLRDKFDENDESNLWEIIQNEMPLFLNYIRNGTQKMDSLLAGLLNYSHHGSASLHIDKISVEEIISGLQLSFNDRIEKYNISITIDELPDCFADLIQLKVVFANLLDNAIKFHTEEGKKEIHISGGKTETMLYYTIKDNGIGIDEKHHDQIFQIFYRINPSKYEGDGLGLTLVEKIINRHGGEIKVKSELKKGSTFTVLLPNISE
ncbi:MAG: GHKL domain-containing protein [Melioribacteraceae bacterium]|nr:GHKL domain-containing protein [Melioribacteraceae bacterium]